MPPKKNQNYRMQLQKKRDATRIKRLQETAEQREKRRSRHRTYAAQARDQSLDLFIRQFQVKMCQELYATIRNHKTEEGRLLCESFVRVPNRWSLADYYDIVTSPIDLLKIQHKLKTKGYTDIQQFTSDVELLVTNAKSYYKENSQEYRDACELWKVFSDAKVRNEEDKFIVIEDDVATFRKVGKIKKRKSYPAKRTTIKRVTGDPKESSSMVEIKEEEYTDTIVNGNESEPEIAQFNLQWLLYETVKNFINSQGCQLSELFLTLPSQSSYPDYYKEIKQPISLYTIRTKIKKRQYTNILKVVADMNLMFKYAKMYNKADSKVFKSAIQLEKVMQAKVKELSSHQHLKRQLTIPHKIEFIEEDTQMQNEETHANSPAESILGSTSDGNETLLYECMWDNCDHQFEDKDHLFTHLTNEYDGHIRQSVKSGDLNKYKCLWYNCPRNLKDVKSFPHIGRLIRHVKTVHLKKFLKEYLLEYRKTRKQLAAFRSLQPDPYVVKSLTLNDSLVTKSTMDYVFQGKCKCNFSDMKVCAETTDVCNVGTVLQCTLCLGKEDPSIEDTNPKSQVPIIDLPHLASIKKELILPDDGVNPSVINSLSEPTKVEMMFYVDQDENSMGSGNMPPGQITMQMRELPNYPNPLLIKQKSKLRIGPQPAVGQQISTTAQLQQSISNQMQVPIIDQPQVPDVRQLPAHTIVQSQVPFIDFSQGASIKQELILPDDGMNPPLINSLSEPTKVKIMFCANREESTTESGSAPPHSTTAMDVTESIATTTTDTFAHGQTSLKWPSGHLSSSTAMNMTTTHGIEPMDALPVDLNLVKKEVDDETLYL